MGRWEDAEKHYLIALEMAPRHIQALINLAAVRVSQKRFAEAKKLYQTAVDIQPDYKLARDALQYLQSRGK